MQRCMATREKLEGGIPAGDRTHRVGAKMLAVHMVHFRKMSIDDAASNLLRCPKWVRNWFNVSKPAGEVSRIVPDLADRPRITPCLAEDGVLQGPDAARTPNYELQQVIHKAGRRQRCTDKRLEQDHAKIRPVWRNVTKTGSHHQPPSRALQSSARSPQKENFTPRKRRF